MDNKSVRVDYLEGPMRERDTQHWDGLDAIRDYYVPIIKSNAQLCMQHENRVLHLLETDWVAAVDLYNATNGFKETIYIQGVTQLQYC